MGMDASLYVEAIKPPDEKFQRFKAVWDVCAASGVEPPDEVARYFNHEDPTDEGVIEAICDVDAMRSPGEGDTEHVAVVRDIYESEDGRSVVGFVVDISKLPPDSQWLKIYVRSSW